ncbi:MAG: acyl-ACP--UDP-N-acetylglucosamine O-acyltransferase [Fimbriimonadaceae bacterium]|nr:acyl-ACP--UDP-N-acetylglucosamine O-acyltransferase [Fimbriimonadaceae bacterium]
MPQIHPTAVVHSDAEISQSVVIGPFCYIEPGVVVGDGCMLDSHVTIKAGTTLGRNNRIFQGAILGGDPQDRKYAGEPTFLEIGDDNVIREYVTIHRATGEGKSTIVGSRNYIMAQVHFGHNCHIGNDSAFTNNVGLAGHVTVEDLVTVGGMSGIHQFVRVGKLAMIGGMTKVVRDVPPFMIVDGAEEAKVHDINAVGLRRLGVSQEARLALHKACKLLFKSQIGLANAIEIVRREVRMTPEVEYLLAFQERLYGGKNGRGDQR